MRIQSQISLGWTPILAVVIDGNRNVLQVTGWEGGNGTIPAIGLYLGANGFVSDIANGVNIRGAMGPTGSISTSNDEIPLGIINNINDTFTLNHIPLVNTLKVYLNGLRLKITKDYNISSLTLTMINIPNVGDELTVDYNY